MVLADRQFLPTRILLCLGALFLALATIALAHSASFGIPSLLNWPTSTAASASAGFGTTAAIFFALFQYVTSQRETRSARNLDAAQRGIKQAWEVIDSDLPSRNMAWVNGARLLLRSQTLSDMLTEREHKAEWKLFVEEWKIRFLRHLSYGHEYYFGFGPKSPFPDDINLGLEELKVIAAKAATVQSIAIPNVGSTSFSNKFVNESAIAAIYDFTLIYDENDDPIRQARTFSSADLYHVQLSNLHGVWTYISVKLKYMFDESDVKERKRD